jgi:hypothetical protein
MSIINNTTARYLLIAALVPFLLMIQTTAFSAISITENNDLPLVAIGASKIIHSDKQDALTVNGQQIIFDDQSAIVFINPDSDKAPTAIDSIQNGDQIIVYGELVGPGILLATEVVVTGDKHVEGASQTYLRAIVEHTGDIGIAYSGNTIIDYTGTLSSDNLSQIKPGDVVEVHGTSFDSYFLAEAGYLVGSSLSTTANNSSAILGQRGSGIRGQRGSGIRGQRGSGIRGQRGSGIRGQRGSGIRGQRGSGIR